MGQVIIIKNNNFKVLKISIIIITSLIIVVKFITFFKS